MKLKQSCLFSTFQFIVVFLDYNIEINLAWKKYDQSMYDKCIPKYMHISK